MQKYLKLKREELANLIENYLINRENLKTSICINRL